MPSSTRGSDLADAAAAVAVAPRSVAGARPRRRGLILRLAGNERVVVGCVVLVATFFVAIFASQLAPYDPNAQVLTARLTPPSATHLFGTDQLGRDVLSRVLWGS